MAAPVRKGEELELRIDSLAYGGNGVARLDGFVVFVRGGLPGDLVRARATKVKRGFAEAIRTALLEPGPDRVAAPCRHFGDLRRLPLPGLRLRRASSRRRSRRCATRSRGSAASPSRRSSRSCPRARSTATATSSSTPSRPARTASRSASTGRAAGTRCIDVEECLLTTDRRQRDPRRGQGVGARGGARAVRPGHADRVPPPPRRARGAEHRAGARRARDRTRRAVRRGLPRRDAHPLPRGALDPLGDQRPAGRGDEPPDAAALGRRLDRGGAARAALPRPAERLPPDEHGDGRDALRARTRRGRADGRRDRLRPLLRDRHDRADPCARRGLRLGRRDLGGVGRLRDRERGGERDRERALLRGQRGAVARGARASTPGRRTSSSSIHREPGSPGRRCAAPALSGHRASSTSRATRRRSRPTSRCCATSTATSSFAARRSTCSRTRRTSRASRFSSERAILPMGTRRARPETERDG